MSNIIIPISESAGIVVYSPDVMRIDAQVRLDKIRISTLETYLQCEGRIVELRNNSISKNFS